MVKRRQYRKPYAERLGRRTIRKKTAYYERPRIDAGLRQIFQKIGIPDAQPFKPDAFQLEALKLVSDYDVLVSAPTGTGKTWIAAQAIREYLSRHLRVWYASPLKALSNSIYQEFCSEFDPDTCGILTGDRKENPGAPVIVGTTEIIRNQLYDSMHKGINISTDLVILDEAHYLNDPERGVVWEEVLIYLPPRVRLLLLSATISNAEQICDWLREIRGNQNRVIRSIERPVPLQTLFIFPDGLVTPLGGKKGVSPKIKKFLASGSGRRGRSRIEFGEIIKCLRKFDLLPAIFFLKSRSDCDKALLTCAPIEGQDRSSIQIENAVSNFLKDLPHLTGHRQMDPLIKSKVGSHHAGQLPYWKVLIENLMKMGILDAIFSTSTVAAGVNFPARTVVLVQSDRYDGHEFKDLTATELHQMIGRAGRRGKDKIGFALIVPGMHQDPEHINALMNSTSEPISSQIQINFSMTLNLLLSHRPIEVKDIIERSFAAYQERNRMPSYGRRMHQMIQRLKNALPKARCDTSDPLEVLDYIQKRRELRARRNRSVHIEDMKYREEYQAFLTPGRIFLHRNNNIYVILETQTQGGKCIYLAQSIKRAAKIRNARVRPVKVGKNQIRAIFDYKIDITGSLSMEKLRQRLRSIQKRHLKILDVDTLKNQNNPRKDILLKQNSIPLPCDECEHVKSCPGSKKGEIYRLLQDIKTLASQMPESGGNLWFNFKRHVRFLKESGFVDKKDRLTPDGFWSSKLRLEQPLLIAEAIRRGAFNAISVELFAGSIAPFVWDRELDIELRIKEGLDLKEAQDMFNRINNFINPIRELKGRRGFSSPPIFFWPFVALFEWAKGISWEELLFLAPADEGDLASLIMRTADHLRQVANLKDTHHDLALKAEEAIEKILREPVYIF